MARLLPSYDWRSFAEGAAHALWISTYINEVRSVADEAPEAARYLSPKPGDRWDDVIPEEPREVLREGFRFTQAVRRRMTVDGLEQLEDALDAESAGYYGMMQALGEGIGWFDYDISFKPGVHWSPSAAVSNAAYDAVEEGLQDYGVDYPNR